MRRPWLFPLSFALSLPAAPALFAQQPATPPQGAAPPAQNDPKPAKASKVYTNDDLDSSARHAAAAAVKPPPPGWTRFSSPELEMQFDAPPEWTTTGRPSETSAELACGQQKGYVNCRVHAELMIAPAQKTSITDEDRARWKIPAPGRPPSVAISGRDIQVAGYPAYEVTFIWESFVIERFVHVFVRRPSRLFLLYIQIAAKPSPSDPRTAALLGTFDELVQSFYPLLPALGSDAATKVSYLPEEKTAIRRALDTWRIYHYSSSNDPGPHEESSDENYTYSCTGIGETAEVTAEPRRAGLGGIFVDNEGVHYEAHGSASHGSPLVNPEDVSRELNWRY